MPRLRMAELHFTEVKTTKDPGEPKGYCVKSNLFNWGTREIEGQGYRDMCSIEYLCTQNSYAISCFLKLISQ